MANTINNKRYYWLKLDRHFFNDIRIKKLRKLAGGDTFTIIYLKLMLLSVEKGGILIYEGVYETFEEEMAEKICEDIENVKVTISYLLSQDMLIEKDNDYLIPQAEKSIGSETYNNVYKKNNRLEKFQSISNQIPIDIDIDKEIDLEEINKKIDELKNKSLTSSLSKEENQMILKLYILRNDKYGV